MGRSLAVLGPLAFPLLSKSANTATAWVNTLPAKLPVGVLFASGEFSADFGIHRTGC